MLSGKERSEPAVALVACEYAPFPGGMATFATNLVNTVRAAGHRVEVIAPGYPDLPPSTDMDVHRVLRHHKIGFRGALAAIRLLRRLPRKVIVTAFDIRTVLFLYLYTRFARRPFRVVIHGSEVAKFTRQPLLKPIVQAAYLGADYVVANSAATLAIFVESFGEPDRSVVAHLGVDEKWFAKAQDTFEDPALAAIDDNEILVVAVGRIEARKGQLETIGIIERAQLALPHHKLTYVVVGRPEDHGYADRVSAEARAKGVRLVMPGRLSDADIVRLYARSLCHILCARPLSSKIEGFGLVLLEAGAQGCPSITTKVGGIPEVVGEDWPLLFDAEDLAGMASKIIELTTDQDMRRSLGIAAVNRSREFTWQRCAERAFPELALT